MQQESQFNKRINSSSKNYNEKKRKLIETIILDDRSIILFHIKSNKTNKGLINQLFDI